MFDNVSSAQHYAIHYLFLLLKIWLDFISFNYSCLELSVLHQKNEYSFFFQSVKFQNIFFESTDLTMLCLSLLLWFSMTHFKNALHFLFSLLFFLKWSTVCSLASSQVQLPSSSCSLQLSFICHLISLLSIIPVTILFILFSNLSGYVEYNFFHCDVFPFNNPNGLKHTCFITTNSITFSSVSLKCQETNFSHVIAGSFPLACFLLSLVECC